MKNVTLTLGAMATAIAATLAFSGAGFAQGYGPGPGPGTGPGCAAADGTTGAGCGYGPGGGRGPGMGMGRGGGYGAQLMTPEERTAHMNAMHSFKTIDECNAYLAEHQKLITERAKEKGLAAPPLRGNRCERMKARGVIS